MENIRGFILKIMAFFGFIFWMASPVLLGYFINNHEWNAFTVTIYGVYVLIWLVFTLYILIISINKGVV